MKFLLLTIFILIVGCNDSHLYESKSKYFVRTKGCVITKCEERQGLYGQVYYSKCDDGNLYSSSVTVYIPEDNTEQLIIPDLGLKCE